MLKPKKYAVYYRDFPSVLSKFITKDGNIQLIKDGVHSGLGYACPRATLIVLPVTDDLDRVRLKAIEQLLTELESNNQIAGYK